MNRQCHRLVFNPARSQFMAVAETAPAQGRQPGESRRSAAASCSTPLRNSIRRTMLATLICAGATPAALAQIIADIKAPQSQRPIVLLDAQGRPLVNIQTPSAAGVSRNTYSQFDIDSRGAVLNNSRGSNPWLSKGEANVILNEVNSSRPSHLAGALTVNGRKAQVVIANPSGLQIDGASFHNVGRLTLTTGSPIVKQGALAGIAVDAGQVAVLSKGLDALGTDYVEVLSRAIHIGGRIDANVINVSTGPHTVDYQTGEMTLTGGSGSTPSWGIDTAALGGMYAGHITLISTEAGVGVRNAGTLQGHATQGQLIVTADGHLENTGNMDAAVTSLATVHGNIDNTGAIQGRQLLLASAGSNFTNHNGVLRAAGDSGQVSITTGQGGTLVLNSGEVSAGGAIQIAGGSFTFLTGVTIHSIHDDITVLSSKELGLASGSSLTGRHVHLETGTPFEQTGGNISIVNSEIRSSQQMAAIAAGDLMIANSEQKESITSAGHIHLQSGRDIMVLSDVHITAGGHFGAHAGRTLALRGAAASNTNPSHFASIQAAKNVTLSAERLELQGPRIEAGQDLTIEAFSSGISMTGLSDKRTELAATGQLDVSAYGGSIDAQGVAIKGRDVSIVSKGDARIGHASSIEASSDLVIASLGGSGELVLGQAVHPAGGPADMGTTLSAWGNMALHAGANATIHQVDAVALRNLAIASATGQINSTQSWLWAGGMLSLSSQNAQHHSGGEHEGGAVSVYSQTGDVQMDATTVTTRRPFGANAQTLGGQASGQLSIEAGGSLTIGPSNVLKASGDIHVVAKEGTLKLAGASGAAGNPSAQVASLTAARDIRVAGAAVEIQGAEIRSGRDTAIASHAGSVLIDGIKNSFANYVPQDQLDALKLEVQRHESKIAEAKNEPAYLQILQEIRDLETALSGIVFHPMVPQLRWPGLLYLQQLTEKRNQANHYGVIPAHTAEISELNRIISTLSSGMHGGEHLGASIQGRDIAITSAEGLAVYGADIAGTGQVTLRSAGTLPLDTPEAGGEQPQPIGTLLAGLSDFYESGAAGSNSHAFALLSRPTVVSGGAGVQVQAVGRSAAGGDAQLILNDVGLASAQGTIQLHSQGDMRLEAGQEEYYSYASRTYTKKSWGGLKKKRITETSINQSIEPSPVMAQGQDISLHSGGGIAAYATGFMAPQGQIQITAANALSLYAVPEVSFSSFDVQKRSSFLGIKYSSSKSTSSREVSDQLPATLVAQGASTQSGWDTLLQGTVFQTSLTGANISAGVGENARADAKIILEGVKRTVTESQTRESNHVVWQRQMGSGSTVQTLALPRFEGQAPLFNAPGGLAAQVPAGEFTAEVQQLASQPGMGYLHDLSQLNDVQWQPVKLAFDQWSYKQEGLTPAGAALLAVAVAVATGGTGAGLVGITSEGAAAAMADAAFASLASQAAITFVNNKGDVGMTLKDLGRSDTVRATVAAAITAGVLDKIGGTQTMKELASKGGLSEKLTMGLINSSGRALTNVAINGGDLTDVLRQALIGGVVDTLHGEVASKIKGLEADYIAHKLAHALAGCVAGAAAQGTCQDGAIGAAVGEVVAGLMPPKNGMFYTDEEKRTVLATSKLIAGATSAYAGGNAQTAITTAETAVQNNALFVIPVVKLLAMAAAAYTTGVGEGNPVEGLKLIGQGEHPLGKAITLGTQEAVSLSMQHLPKETTAMLNLMAAAGEQIDAVISYLDSATGQVLSTHWNELSLDSRHALIGAGKVTGLVLSPVGVGQVKSLVTNMPTATVLKFTTAANSASKSSASDFIPASGKTVSPAVDGQFATQGLTRDPMTFPEGVQMVNLLEQTGMSREAAVREARAFVNSGRTLPVATPLDMTDKLVKVVPAGGSPSPSTGYWMKESELRELQRDVASMANKLGLPPGMHVNSYDIYQIAPKQGAVVYESTIARTTVNGLPNTNGGAKQSLVLDRSQFTLPVKIGNIAITQ